MIYEDHCSVKLLLLVTVTLSLVCYGIFMSQIVFYFIMEWWNSVLTLAYSIVLSCIANMSKSSLKKTSKPSLKLTYKNVVHMLLPNIYLF